MGCVVGKMVTLVKNAAGDLVLAHQMLIIVMATMFIVVNIIINSP